MCVNCMGYDYLQRPAQYGPENNHQQQLHTSTREGREYKKKKHYTYNVLLLGSIVFM